MGLRTCLCQITNFKTGEHYGLCMDHIIVIKGFTFRASSIEFPGFLMSRLINNLQQSYHLHLVAVAIAT